jgi:DICT domain-containing protein
MAVGATPVQVTERSRRLRVATKRHLLAVSRHLEDQTSNLGEAAVLLSGFQTRERFAPGTRRRYRKLAERAAFVAAFGLSMGEHPEPGVRGAAVASDDPLVDEWDVAVVAPHFAALLAARDLGDQGPDLDRRFEFVVTYDRDLVLQAASSLMARISPSLAA